MHRRAVAGWCVAFAAGAACGSPTLPASGARRAEQGRVAVVVPPSWTTREHVLEAPTGGARCVVDEGPFEGSVAQLSESRVSALEVHDLAIVRRAPVRIDGTVGLEVERGHARGAAPPGFLGRVNFSATDALVIVCGGRTAPRPRIVEECASVFESVRWGAPPTVPPRAELDDSAPERTVLEGRGFWADLPSYFELLRAGSSPDRLRLVERGAGDAALVVSIERVVRSGPNAAAQTEELARAAATRESATVDRLVPSAPDQLETAFELGVRSDDGETSLARYVVRAGYGAAVICRTSPSATTAERWEADGVVRSLTIE